MVSCGHWLIHFRSINLGSGGQYPNHLDGYGYSEAAGFKHRLTLRAVMNQLSASMCDLLSRSVVSIFQCFVAGIHSCWASPQAKVLSAEDQALVIVASHCILTSELERFCETNLAQCCKAGGKYLCETHVFGQTWQMFCKSICQSSSPCATLSHHPWRITKTDPLLLSSVATRDLPSCQPIDFQEPPVV